MVELINFSGSKWSFGRCDSADCKHRGTKWSAEGSELVPSQSTSRKPCNCIWYSPTFLQYWIRNNQLCMLRIKNYLFFWKRLWFLNSANREKKNETVYLKLNLAQSTKQERSKQGFRKLCIEIAILIIKKYFLWHLLKNSPDYKKL